MKSAWRWRPLGAAGLGAVLAASAGCQTWVGGMTLPSGHYLQHQPQYFPPSPPFPLPRELASQEAAAAAGIPAPAAVPAPAPVVPTPATPPAAVAPAVPGAGPEPPGR